MINFAESPENINLVSPKWRMVYFLRVFFENPQLGKNYCNNKQDADEKTLIIYTLTQLKYMLCSRPGGFPFFWG